jgi:hypothetical protein
MGEITAVDLNRLRRVADRVWDAATEIGGMQWPGLGQDALRGSAVADIASPAHVAAQLEDLVADMRGWALAARGSADALERADREHGDRMTG